MNLERRGGEGRGGEGRGGEGRGGEGRGGEGRDRTGEIPKLQCIPHADAALWPHRYKPNQVHKKESAGGSRVSWGPSRSSSHTLRKRRTPRGRRALSSTCVCDICPRCDPGML